MKSYSRNVFISSSPDECFDYLTDQTRISEWLPAIEECKVVPSGPVRVGTEFHQMRRDGKKLKPVICKVTDHVRGKIHAVELHFAGLVARFEYTFAGETNGTRVTMNGSLNGRGFAKILELLIWPAVERTDKEAMNLLRDAMMKSR